MRKFVGIVALIGLVGMFAYAQNVATDYNGPGTVNPIINHSSGVIAFPYDKLQRTRSINVSDGGVSVNRYSSTLNYYATLASYPTTFVPLQTNGNSLAAAYDAGCQIYQMIETTTAVSGQKAAKPAYCMFDRPIWTADAGVVNVFKADDGGYGISQCPSLTALATSPWPAFCFVQNGAAPAVP